MREEIAGSRSDSKIGNNAKVTLTFEVWVTVGCVLLNGADFNGIGTIFVAIARNDDGSEVFLAFFELEVISF